MSETAANQAGDPLDRAMRHIEAHRLELLTLEGLAAVAGLSAYHFAREFAARFGVSPMAYARARRMAAAAEQLSGERPPANTGTQYLIGRNVSRYHLCGPIKHCVPVLARLVARLPLPGQTGFETYGVCWGDADGRFHYMAAAPIAADASEPRRPRRAPSQFRQGRRPAHSA